MNTKQTTREKFYADADKWENRELGAEEEYVKRSSMPEALKKLLNGKTEENPNGKMQLISIRLPEALIDDLKRIGEIEGLGYQTLARTVLHRFVEAENRKELNKVLAENIRLERELKAMREDRTKAQETESNKQAC
ncbi:hypothetical protein [Psychrobacter immobilis]|uniref:hypothetical protein n=1 Tax=Psychrobacter immobilis TaxID=498 RepID=UPI001919AF43|nr:hypothetical protein [Psychrobacter immobilis]